MAQNIGNLIFGIDGDDKLFKAKLEALKKDAVSIEQIFKNIKIDAGGGNKLSTDIQKAQLSADKLAISANKVTQSTEDASRATARLNNEVNKGAEIEARKARLAAQTALEVARSGEVQLRRDLQLQRSTQQTLEHEARLETIRLRNARLGGQGQGDFRRSVDDTNKSLAKQESTLSSLEKKMISAFSGYQLARYAKEIINIRGEFQGLELAFTTMLGSADKSRRMMSEITNLALESPYTVSEVANNTKQLIAMGIEADKAMATMKALGDVSAGLSVPMWRIAINYGQVSALGRLQAREIRDFAMAGVPIVEELAKQLGKTTAEITDMVSAGKIGFPEVERAFQSMAGSGGKFNDMMAKQNSTVKGQMNRLEDQLQLMMNAIGQSNEGAIYTAIDLSSKLIENYETVGKIVLGLVATYGTYKAILIALSVIEQTRVAIALTQITSATTLTATQTALAVSTNVLSVAFGRLNKVLIASPYVLAAAAIVALGYGIYEISTAASDAEISLNALNRALDNHIEYVSDLKSETDQLLSIINSEIEVNEKKILNYNKLKELYPAMLSNIDMFTLKTMSAIEQQKLFNQAIYEQGEAFKKSEIKQMESLLDRIKSSKEKLDNTSVGARRAVAAGEYESVIKEAREILGVGGFFDHFTTTHLEVSELLKNHIAGLKKNMTDSADAIKTNVEEFVTFEKQVDKAKSSVSDLKKELSNLKKGTKPSNLKEGEQFDFAKGIEDKAKELKDAEEKLNILVNGNKKSRSSSSKDPVIKKLEDQVDLLKKARQEYEKLSKVMGADAAFGEISKNTAFENISKNDLTDDGYLSYIDTIIKKISTLKSSTESKKLLGELFTLKTDVASEVAKKNGELIEKELTRYKSQYDLYEYVLGKTGDKNNAMQVAFGDVSESVKTYKEKLKEEIDRTDNTELKKKLSEQFTNLEFTDTVEFSKRMADLLSEFQSIDDKITAIKEKGEQNRLEIEKNADKANQSIVDARLKANQESTNKQIADLTNGVIQATSSYQKLFSDFNNISTKELNILIKKWRKAVDGAVKNADGSMTLNIDNKEFITTEKEIASFTKKILKSEEDLRKRNPFAALQNSLKKLSSDKSQISVIKKEIKSLQDLLAISRADNIVDDNHIRELQEKIKKLQDELKDAQGESATSIQRVGNEVKDLGSQISDVADSLSSMFEALGEENTADTVRFIGELTSSFAELGAGIANENPVQIVQGIAGSITSIANFHDKRLDKQIKKSQLELKKLQGSYADLSRFISRQLGAVTSKQAKEQIDNLKTQQQELKNQQAYEEDKKKKDRSAIEDYKNSIKELQDQINYFYEDLFNEQYGIDLSGISDQLSSALVEAFKNGEDAAVVFDSTVSDIINDLAGKMISLEVIQPAMKRMRDYLFGDNGVFKDGELSVKDAQGLTQQMLGLKDTIGQSQTIWDALNEAAKAAGVNLGGVSEKNGLSQGIKEITEDTANLLASYINAIRADVSFNKTQILQLVKISQLNQVSLGQMLAQLIKIQLNTLNTANNTKEIAETVKETKEILKSATISGSPIAFNIN